MNAKEFIEQNGCEHDGSFVPISEVYKLMESYASQQMPSVKRIREFIKRQRYVGECQMGDKMRKRHGKSAKEFYDQFADEVFYTDKNGSKIGLDIQTLWHFRTKDMLIEELQEEIKLLKSKI